ncbi:hypothetical protein HID58_027392, partial [Brassica napus]
MESGIDAPLPSSSNVVGHEISVSENVNEPVVKPLSLLSPSAMSSSSLLTVSSPALTDSVCGGSLSLVSMPSASSVLLNTTTGMSQVQTIGSDIASSPSAVFSGVDPSRTLENSEGQGEGFMVSPVVDTGLDSTQSPQLQSVRTRSVDTDITENTQSESSHQETVFVPTLGAWAKPLLFKPPATPTTPSTPTDNELAKVGNQLAALWPTLNDAILNKKPKTKQPTRTLMPPVEKLPLPELKPDGSLRFPWAARLSPQSRNLYRAASPTYRLDGTPEISIPSKVLKLGPENKDDKHSEDSIGADPTATIQDPIDTAHDSTLNPTASPEVCTSNLKTTTLSFSSPSQLEKPASPLTSATPPDTLVDSQSTPTATPIMDCYPSKITNNEVIESLVVDLMTTTPIHCAFESSSRF